MDEAIEKFKAIVIANCARPDFAYREWFVEYHLNIVERIALELCDRYVEADRDLVRTLVWFHDFGKPLDEANERRTTLEQGPKCMTECGFSVEFIAKTLEYWQLMEQKETIDLRTAPIEVQIVSSADGASHFTGTFYAGYFADGEPFSETQQQLREKIEKDWQRKIVLPELKESFKGRYIQAKELLGEFPEHFIN